MAPEKTDITLHPMDPNNSEQVARTEEFLRFVCGPDNVNQRNEPECFSWVVSLSHTNLESIHEILENPWLRIYEIAKDHLKETARRLWHAEHCSDRCRCDDDIYYIITAKDYRNDEETKTTQGFFTTRMSDPNQKFTVFHHPGTNHIIGWGHIQFSATALDEVATYPGVKSWGYDGPVYDD